MNIYNMINYKKKRGGGVGRFTVTDYYLIT